MSIQKKNDNEKKYYKTSIEEVKSELLEKMIQILKKKVFDENKIDFFCSNSIIDLLLELPIGKYIKCIEASTVINNKINKCGCAGSSGISSRLYKLDFEFPIYICDILHWGCCIYTDNDLKHQLYYNQFNCKKRLFDMMEKKLLNKFYNLNFYFNYDEASDYIKKYSKKCCFL